MESSSSGDDSHRAGRDSQAALRRIMRLQSAGRPAPEIWEAIASAALEGTDACTAALAIRRDSGRVLEFVAAVGDCAESLVGLRLKAGGRSARGLLWSDKPVLLGRQPDDSLPRIPIPRELSGGRPSAGAIVPIPRGGSIEGVLVILDSLKYPRHEPFTGGDLDSLAFLADHASVTLALTECAEIQDIQRRELRALQDSSRNIGGSLNAQEVMQAALDAVCSQMDHRVAILYLMNDERTRLFIAADRGLSDEDREVQLAAESRSVASVLQSIDATILTCAEDAAEVAGTAEFSPECAITAPIRSRNEVIGLLAVACDRVGAYQLSDMKVLEAVASHAGTAISNAWLFEDADRRAEEAAALYDLSQHVNATLHLDRVFNFVADNVVGLLRVDKFALMLLDPLGERLVTQVSRGFAPERFSDHRPCRGEGIAGWVLEWLTPTAVADVAADARNRSAPIHQEGVVSAVCVPMAVGDEVIGVMMAMSSRRRLFTVAEMELLYTIANQAAVAIVNAKLYQDARSKSLQMRRYFHRVARALGSALESQDAPQLLADLALETMRGDRCAVYRVEDGAVLLHAASNFRPALMPQASIPVGEGLVGWVARRGRPLTVENLAGDTRSAAHAWLNRDRLTSYTAVPLKAARKTVGVLEIYTQDQRAFTSEEQRMLTQFVRRARLAERIAVE